MEVPSAGMATVKEMETTGGLNVFDCVQEKRRLLTVTLVVVKGSGVRKLAPADAILLSPVK